MRGPLLLLLSAAWFWSPDMALALDGDPSGATYQANGLYGAALALIAADAVARPGAPSLFDAAVMALSAVLWALQFACDLFWAPGQPTAAVCDDVTNRPITVLCALALLAVAVALDITRRWRRG